MRLGWSIPLPGPFRLSGTIWRSKRRRKRRKGGRAQARRQAPQRPVFNGTLPDGWRCPHNHSRPDLALACGQKEARRRAAIRPVMLPPQRPYR